ncbi:MAG TPA: aspartate/glutamate racemase family protein [Candidatus Saccharimonadales bacterium]
MKIGVFDSGVGGLSVAQAISKALPEHEVLLREDKEHVPYGIRTPEQIFSFVVPIFEEMISAGCQIIVVACNTVSTTLITQLRARFPDTPLVAMEPMVKPAVSLTKSGVIAVCATPATLASPRYHWLKETYAAGITVLEPDCGDWAAMIEQSKVDESKIAGRLEAVLAGQADVLVLGCTHYHWIETEIRQLAAGRALVLQPEQAVIAELRRVITTRTTELAS